MHPEGLTVTQLCKIADSPRHNNIFKALEAAPDIYISHWEISKWTAAAVWKCNPCPPDAPRPSLSERRAIWNHMNRKEKDVV